MEKNILIINSLPGQDNSLLSLFSEIKARGYILRFLTNSPRQKQRLKECRWPNAKLHCFSAETKKLKLIYFILSLPFFYVLFFIYLIWQKIKYKTKIIICFSWPEKILLTLFARILKIDTIWLEIPGEKKCPKQFLLKKIYKISAKKAKLIILNKQTKTKLLNLNVPEKNIFYLAPGLKKANFLRQENIFSKLVEAEQTKRNKYFTIGTILPALNKDKTEILCQAIKNCLTIIHNPQLIILGDKKNKQNLDWYTKKIGIDNITWFVGEPAFPGKWLSNFDIFVFSGQILTLPDYFLIIKAAALGLPIIGPEEIGLEDIIINGQNGYLINVGNSELLAQNIIRLQQNTHLRKRLGKAGKEIVNKNFQLDKMTEQFIAVLEK